MNDEATLTADREAVLLAVLAETTDEERQAAVEDEQRSDLQRRLQELSPEALAGEPEALADLAKAEAELATLERRDQLRRLAAAETTAREQAATEAEHAAKVETWKVELAEHEAARDDALARFEKQLPAALEAAREAIEENNLAASLQSSIKPGSGYRRLHSEVEVRLLRLVRDYLAMYGIRPDMIRESQGKTPLVAVAHCAVCKHQQRAQIEAALDAGETLAAVVERFEGFSKSTLSRHGAHRG